MGILSCNTISDFTEYLSSFSVHTAASKNMFDEYSQHTSFNDALKLDTYVEKKVIEIIEKSNWLGAILLSGNAGDGKSRLCRSVQSYFGYEGSNQFVLRDGREVQIISDISEYSEEKTKEILTEAFNKERVYLICANEGRVQTVLKYLNMHEKETIERQMKEGPEYDAEGMIIFNLNLFPTSSYLENLISKIVSNAEWNSCNSCPANNVCPILFNKKKFELELILNRFKSLYQMIEEVGNHITMREMLAHVIYSLLGGQTCKSILDKYQQKSVNIDLMMEETVQDITKQFVYYRNIWGDNLSRDVIERNTVFRVMQDISISNISSFKVDNFIIQGDITESDDINYDYNTIFSPSLDLGGRDFHYSRAKYLSAGGIFVNEEAEVNSFLEQWLGQMRRKVFFEWERTPVNEMVPFQNFTDYITVLETEECSELKLKEVILALNRIFTGLYLSYDEKLLLTAHFYGGSERQLPIVEHEIPAQNLMLYVESDDLLGQKMKRLVLTHMSYSLDISPPKLYIDLLVFEYLHRIKMGGSRKSLSRLCELRLLKFKEELMAHLNYMKKINPMMRRGSKSGLKLIFRDEDGNYNIKQLNVQRGEINFV